MDKVNGGFDFYNLEYARCVTTSPNFAKKIYTVMTITKRQVNVYCGEIHGNIQTGFLKN